MARYNYNARNNSYKMERYLQIYYEQKLINMHKGESPKEQHKLFRKL